MNWEEKLVALQAISDASLRMRMPGDWYVDLPSAEIKGDGVLTGIVATGATPQQAVEATWKQCATGQTIVLHAYTKVRREVRWNGYMWVDVPRTEAAR